MFKVGDFITGERNNGYSCTNDKALMVVVYAKENYRRMIVMNIGTTDTDSSLNQVEYCKSYDVENDENRFHRVKCDISLVNFNRSIFSLFDGKEDMGDYYLGTREIITKEESLNYFKQHNTFEEDKIVLLKDNKIQRCGGMIADGLYIGNKEDKLVWTSEEVTEIANKVEELLDNYEIASDQPYTYGHDYVIDFVRESNEKKGWIEKVFSKHPNYERGTHSIRTIDSYYRQRNIVGINLFVTYLTNLCKEKFVSLAITPPFSKEEATENKNDMDRYYVIKSCFEKIASTRLGSISQINFNGMNYEYVCNKFEEYKNLNREWEKYTYEYSGFFYCDTEYKLSEEDCAEYKRVMRFINMIPGLEERITDSQAEIINNEYKMYDFIRAVGGQKTSTIVRKFAKHYGFDQHVDMRPVESINENTGELIQRIDKETGEVAMKDYGWNKQFAMYCDANMPKEIKMQTVISVNPMDYLTMSFGHGWASCQTIDKTDIRGGSSNYQGCYSGGTTDLATDGATIVVYLLPQDYKGDEPFNQDKIKRCLFYFDDDKFVQSRVYPDGRDGTDYTDAAGTIRKIVEKALSKCNSKLDVENFVEYSKEKEEVDMYSQVQKVSGSLHYDDYFQYSDIFLVKHKKIYSHRNKIQIGNRPICLKCGSRHSNAEAILCEYCVDEDRYVSCECCGESIREDEALWISGYPYCDDECAERAGYHYCEDSDSYVHEDYCYYDDYYEHWYSYDDDDRISTEDGYDYHGITSAESAGYTETSNGYWYPEDEVYYCSHCEEYVHESDWNNEYECCNACVEDVKAEREEAEESTEE